MAKRQVVTEGTSENLDSPNETGVESRSRKTVKPSDDADTLSPRLNLPVTADGHFNFASMQGKTRERLAKAIAETPDLGGALAVQVPIIAAAAAPVNAGVKESAVIGLLGMISASAVEIVGQNNPPAIAQLAGLTPDEITAVAPVATRVANKYAPAVLSKYADELELLGMALALAWTKYQAIRAARAGLPTVPAVTDVAPQSAGFQIDPAVQTPAA